MSENIYFPNPKRGCGTKVPGGYYAETEMSRGGVLNLWTWLLGDGLEGGINCLTDIPPRRAIYGNLAASLVFGEFVGADVPMDTIGGFGSLREMYDKFCGRTADIALFDHVGTKYYTPWSFAQETQACGPSRRIPPALAEELAKRVPVPVVFTHSRVPIFRDEAERAEAIVLAEELMGILAEETDTYATWLNPEWGIYAKNHDGHDHYMVWVLGILDKLVPDFLEVTDNETWHEAAEFFSTINYAEQPFGVSWLTRIGYVPTEGDDVTAVSHTLNRKGIQIIDINAPDPVPTMAQVQEQRHNPLTGRFVGGERES